VFDVTKILFSRLFFAGLAAGPTTGDKDGSESSEEEPAEENFRHIKHKRAGPLHA
jgi:hypothetical protein